MRFFWCSQNGNVRHSGVLFTQDIENLFHQQKYTFYPIQIHWNDISCSFKHNLNMNTRIIFSTRKIISRETWKRISRKTWKWFRSGTSHNKYFYEDGPGTSRASTWYSYYRQGTFPVWLNEGNGWPCQVSLLLEASQDVHHLFSLATAEKLAWTRPLLRESHDDQASPYWVSCVSRGKQQQQDLVHV